MPCAKTLLCRYQKWCDEFTESIPLECIAFAHVHHEVSNISDVTESTPPIQRSENIPNIVRDQNDGFETRDTTGTHVPIRSKKPSITPLRLVKLDDPYDFKLDDNETIHANNVENLESGPDTSPYLCCCCCNRSGGGSEQQGMIRGHNLKDCRPSKSCVLQCCMNAYGHTRVRWSIGLNISERGFRYMLT